MGSDVESSFSDDMILCFVSFFVVLNVFFSLNKCSREDFGFNNPSNKQEPSLYCSSCTASYNISCSWNNISADSSTLPWDFNTNFDASVTLTNNYITGTKNEILEFNEKSSMPQRNFSFGPNDSELEVTTKTLTVETLPMFDPNSDEFIETEIGIVEKECQTESRDDMETTTFSDYEENQNMSYIVGGEPMEISKAPSYAFIVAFDSKGAHACSGNLISASHVLTAAHCVVFETKANGTEHYIVYKPDQLKVRIGSSYSTKGGKLMNAKNIQVHPSYGKDSHLYGYRDVAVVTFSDSFHLDSSTSPAAVHPQLSDKEMDSLIGTKCTVAGWGRTSEHKNSSMKSDHLLHITVTILSMEACKTFYLNRVDFQVHVCTLEQGKSGCHGDSGGGLFCNNKIIGVISWGDSCSGSKPTVNARVDNVQDFIQKAKNN